MSDIKQADAPLSGGEQQMLAIGRALRAQPVMLMLVLENGAVAVSGDGAELLTDDRVWQAYLGL